MRERKVLLNGVRGGHVFNDFKTLHGAVTHEVFPGHELDRLSKSCTRWSGIASLQSKVLFGCDIVERFKGEH